jgi:phosphoenolpyruvate carboxykinase (ATP)
MSRHPSEYGQMLAERLDETGANCWLLNTGWTGGAYGTGHRMPLKMTRRILNAALSGELDNVEFHTDPAFGLSVPTAIEGVDASVLDPRSAWADPAAYDKQADELVAMFEANLKNLGAKAIGLAGTGSLKTKAA